MQSVTARPNKLSSKENSLLKTAYSLNEAKQYKKGLKVINSLLKMRPELSEAMAMKGLFQYHLGNAEEGFVTIKTAVSSNLNSLVSWHIYGIVHKLERRYGEAIKCYKRVLNIEPKSRQFIQDLGYLFLHTENWVEVLKSAKSLFMLLYPSAEGWLWVLKAAMLVKQYGIAEKLLSIWVSQYGESQLHLAKLCCPLHINFCTFVYESAQNLKMARKYIELHRRCPNRCMAKGAWGKEKEALYRLYEENYNEARPLFDELVEANPDSVFYVNGLLSCMAEKSLRHVPYLDARELLADPSFSIGPEEIVQEVYERFKSSLYLQGKVLFFRTLPIGTIRKNLETILNTHFRNRCVPVSIFQPVVSMCIREMEENARDQLADLFQQLKITETGLPEIHGLEHPLLMLFDEVIKTFLPAYPLFVKALLAFLYVSVTRTTTPRITAILLELETDKEIDVLVHASRLHSAIGDVRSAISILTKAREMDPRDRSTNSILSLALFANNQCEEASRMASQFVMGKTNNTPISLRQDMKDLMELQPYWFIAPYIETTLYTDKISECIEATYFGLSHMLDMYHDRLDFHMYLFKRKAPYEHIQMLKSYKCFDSIGYNRDVENPCNWWPEICNLSIELWKQIKAPQNVRPLGFYTGPEGTNEETTNSSCPDITTGTERKKYSVQSCNFGELVLRAARVCMKEMLSVKFLSLNRPMVSLLVNLSEFWAKSHFFLLSLRCICVLMKHNKPAANLALIITWNEFLSFSETPGADSSNSLEDFRRELQIITNGDPIAYTTSQTSAWANSILATTCHGFALVDMASIYDCSAPQQRSDIRNAINQKVVHSIRCTKPSCKVSTEDCIGVYKKIRFITKDDCWAPEFMEAVKKKYCTFSNFDTATSP